MTFLGEAPRIALDADALDPHQGVATSRALPEVDFALDVPEIVACFVGENLVDPPVACVPSFKEGEVGATGCRIEANPRVLEEKVGQGLLESRGVPGIVGVLSHTVCGFCVVPDRKGANEKVEFGSDARFQLAGVEDASARGGRRNWIGVRESRRLDFARLSHSSTRLESTRDSTARK